MTKAVKLLSELLREARSTPRLSSESITSSAVYDPVYRIALIALAIRTCAKPKDSVHRIADAKLRLIQFVAVHHHFLPSLRGWIRAHEAGERPTLDGWAQFPHGYASDGLHERIVTYLVAIGELRREGKYVTAHLGTTPLLDRLLLAVDAGHAFEAEFTAIRELASTRITLGMLGV